MALWPHIPACPKLPIDSCGTAVGPTRARLPVTAFLAGLFTFAFAGLSCNETLPTYVEPKSLLEAGVQAEFERVGRDAIPQFSIYLRIRNTFDETLQGRKQLTGIFDVVLVRAPQYRATIAINQSHAIYPYLLRWQATPTLTFDSADSLVFLYPWDLYDDNGVYLPTDVFSYDTARHVGVPEEFEISGSFQVFNNTGQVVIPPTRCILNYR